MRQLAPKAGAELDLTFDEAQQDAEPVCGADNRRPLTR
jgi:hypothetical protein